MERKLEKVEGARIFGGHFCLHAEEKGMDTHSFDTWTHEKNLIHRLMKSFFSLFSRCTGETGCHLHSLQGVNTADDGMSGSVVSIAHPLPSQVR